jgi:hypothetical protein
MLPKPLDGNECSWRANIPDQIFCSLDPESN